MLHHLHVAIVLRCFVAQGCPHRLDSVPKRPRELRNIRFHLDILTPRALRIHGMNFT